MFCFYGYVAMRIIIPIWGTFAGFLLGAGVVAGATGDGFLGTTASWITGIIVGLLFGALAYVYFEVSIVLAMSAVGFALGTSLMVALGVSWSWLIVLVGVIVGALLAIIAIVGDLPSLVLLVLSAFGGASAVVLGVMLLVGTVGTDDLDRATTTKRVDDNPWWYVLYLGLAVAGMVVQIQRGSRLTASAREQWAASSPGGHPAPVA